MLKRWMFVTRPDNLNSIHLLPNVTELRVYDKSEEADPFAGQAPEPTPILHWVRGTIVSSCDLGLTPDWAKPILAAAIKAASKSRHYGK